MAKVEITKLIFEHIFTCVIPMQMGIQKNQHYHIYFTKNYRHMLIKVKNFLKINWRLILIILAAITFFIATSSYNFVTQNKEFVKWSSPDETAN